LETYHHDRIGNDSLVAGNMSASGMFTNRKLAWIAAFTVFSATLFILSPGIGVALIVALIMSILHVISVDRQVDLHIFNPVFGIFAGSLLAATLLWISVLAGSDLANLFGLSGYGLAVGLASVIGLILYAALTVAESLLAMGLQYLISRNHNAAPRIACQIDSKFAGFFGEIR